MPDKFVVPQFIDNEDKILGPITVRQFLICLFSMLPVVILYTILPFMYFVPSAVLVVGIAMVFAFLKVNGQPFHIFAVNALQTAARPPLRVWNRQHDEAQLRAFIKQEQDRLAKPVVESFQRKERPTSRHLQDLSLMVNTGGVYNPDEDARS